MTNVENNLWKKNTHLFICLTSVQKPGILVFEDMWKRELKRGCMTTNSFFRHFSLHSISPLSLRLSQRGTAHTLCMCVCVSPFIPAVALNPFKDPMRSLQTNKMFYSCSPPPPNIKYASSSGISMVADF